MVSGEEENEEKESDLSLRRRCLKIDAGGALLVREVGVALLLCFTREGGVCVSTVFVSRVLQVVEIGRVPSINNIGSVSTMTTADSAVCISTWRLM